MEDGLKGEHKCPRCGVGLDTDGDGDCVVCAGIPDGVLRAGRINEQAPLLDQIGGYVEMNLGLHRAHSERLGKLERWLGPTLLNEWQGSNAMINSRLGSLEVGAKEDAEMIGELARRLSALESNKSEEKPEENFIDIVLDGPPDHCSGRFVGVEDSKGSSISGGKWIRRENDFWALRIPCPLRGTVEPK